MRGREGLIALMIAVLLGCPGRVHADDDGKVREGQFGGRVRTPNGVEVSWGLSSSLLLLRASRNPNEDGRTRDYQLQILPFPGDFGVMVHIDPPGMPFQANGVTNGERTQMISASILLGARVDPNIAAQSSVFLGFGLSFFNSVIGLAVTFDLYRGVPMRGFNAEGAPVAGAATAYTGLLSWAFASEGEVTAENFGLALILDVASLATSLGLR